MTGRKLLSVLLCLLLAAGCTVPAAAAGQTQLQAEFENLTGELAEGVPISGDIFPSSVPSGYGRSNTYVWTDYVETFSNSARQLTFPEQLDSTWHELVYLCNLDGYFLFAFEADGTLMEAAGYDAPIFAGQHFLLTDPDVTEVYALVDIVADAGSGGDLQPAPSPDATPSASAPGIPSISSRQQEGIDLVNAFRTEYGVLALEGNAEACAAAQIRANEMAKAGVLSHTRPNGTDCFTVFSAPYPVGENIAINGASFINPAAVLHTQWVNSPGHRKNMVNREFKQIGIAYAQSADGAWYGCQLFCGSGSVQLNEQLTPMPTVKPTEELTPEPAETPSPEPTETPSPEPTETPSPEPTETPSPEPTETPSPEPTETPSPEPTEAPTPVPTEAPTPTPQLTSRPGPQLASLPGYQSGTSGGVTYYAKTSGASIMYYVKNRLGKTVRVAPPYITDKAGTRFWPVQHGGTVLYPVTENSRVTSYCRYEAGREIPVLTVKEPAAGPERPGGFQILRMCGVTYYAKTSGATIQYYVKNRLGKTVRVAPPYVTEKDGACCCPVNHGGMVLIPQMSGGRVTSYGLQTDRGTITVLRTAAGSR